MYKEIGQRILYCFKLALEFFSEYKAFVSKKIVKIAQRMKYSVQVLQSTVPLPTSNFTWWKWTVQSSSHKTICQVSTNHKEKPFFSTWYHAFYSLFLFPVRTFKPLGHASSTHQPNCLDPTKRGPFQYSLQMANSFRIVQSF
jgi:hypothetical protein